MVRLISSLGIGSMVLVTTLVAEYVPTARRSLILGMLQTGVSAGPRGMQRDRYRDLLSGEAFSATTTRNAPAAGI
ncbi:hypothetical protein [Caballeronia sp. DA-9]|uniref:hypothetical protein n=1 Tax=Caballeronia sp. DA-9 TaxID=3436237 RepID=UPI003F66945C